MLPHVLQQLPQLPQQNARQPALAIVLAAASGTNAGRVLSTAAKQLTPGNMLAQTAAGEFLPMHRASHQGCELAAAMLLLPPTRMQADACL
jgi:hypothetical protein